MVETHCKRLKNKFSHTFEKKRSLLLHPFALFKKYCSKFPFGKVFNENNCLTAFILIVMLKDFIRRLKNRSLT